LIQWK